MSEVAVTEVSEVQKQYVCFVKRRAGSRFIGYTEPGDSRKLAVRTLREFLDHDISKWYNAGQEDKVLLRVSIDEFMEDVDTNGMNSKYAGMLGWNYSEAVRLVESEGWVFILSTFPRFQSIPFSYRRVCEDDDYALDFLRQIWGLRGGEIVFEEYDTEKHVAGYQYQR
jgi:hypothetical protein